MKLNVSATNMLGMSLTFTNLWSKLVDFFSLVNSTENLK